MKTSLKFISHLIFLFVLCNTNNVYAQSSSNFKKSKKTYSQIIEIFKKTSIPTSTANFKLGGYENILLPYLDINEINNTISKVDSNATFSHNLIYELLYLSLSTWHSHTKKIPTSLIKVIPYTKSISLTKNWRKNRNANEVAKIENSIRV